MRLARRGENFSENIIFNDSIALVKVRGTDISKIIIIGGFPGSMRLDEEGKAPKQFLNHHRLALEEEDFEKLRGGMLAIYETKKGKKESLFRKGKQLADILNNDIFSKLTTIELIGYGYVGAIFLLAAQYVKRSLHIVTVNIEETMPYFKNLYGDEESLEKLSLKDRAKYRNRFLKNIDFDIVANKHAWLNFQDQKLEVKTTLMDYNWIKEMNQKMVTESSLRISNIPVKNVELDLNYSDLSRELFRYFDR